MIIGVRHAPVEAAMEGRCYGRSNAATALSCDDAASAALSSLAALAGGVPSFDHVWTSDLIRCRGLAESLAERLTPPLDVRVDARLQELDHGSFEGRKWDEIHVNDCAALSRWGTSWEFEGPPGGESARSLGDRVAEWRSSLNPGELHLLVGHAGVMRALIVLHEGLSWTEAMATPIAHLKAIRLR